MAKNTDYTSKKDIDLRKEISSLREDVRSAKANITDRVQGNKRKTTRRTIARIQTELSSRAKSSQA
ncbi:hypothetical protein H6776_00045 [Candidatus Nomurabacteria bacterium]|nr:hypothetical protein [Candidatus Nomurabacteria bacterium]